MGELFEYQNELSYRGPNVCLAIIEAGKIHFLQGVYVLSDTLRRDDKGHYFYLQRRDFILNRGGEKFSLEEIENIVKAMGFDCVAMKWEHLRLGQDLALAFEGSVQDKERIHQELQQKYKRSFDKNLMLPLNKIPQNANAKPDRDQCKQLILRIGQ